jgi:hypothetical protein
LSRSTPAQNTPTARRVALSLAASAAAVARAALVAVGAPPGAPADRGGGRPAAARAWTRWVNVDLSARELGLRADASAQRLARAALRRNARGLGLRGSGLRLARDDRSPAADGARAVRYLRFQQTAAGLRVVWSQIDVTVAAGRVRSIAATVVPVRAGAAVGRRTVGRARALRIARRAVVGPDRARRPLLVAYAGKPSRAHAAKPRPARRAWVIEVRPAAARRPEGGGDVCLVVDAETGKVIARWPGMADRVERPARADAAGAPAAHASATSRLMVTVIDASNGTEPSEVTYYSDLLVSGDPHRGVNWPFFGTLRPGVTRATLLDNLGVNARNVAFTVCAVRDVCGPRRGFWRVLGNDPDSNRDGSYVDRLTNFVSIADRNVMARGGDPKPPFNDVIAHEFGHIMDWDHAGDRTWDELSLEGQTVQEALADMFAYDYDREDATLGEEGGGVARDWQNPGSVTVGPPVQRRRYPAHMDHYDPTPPTDEHFNSTILSHACYLFVQQVGHDKAGRVLHNVPQRLSPRPTFNEVRRAFHDSASVLYGASVALPAIDAFRQVGLEPPPHDEPDCGPQAC